MVVALVSVTITSVASPGQRYLWAECSTEHWIVLIFVCKFQDLRFIWLIWDWFYWYNESDIDFIDICYEKFQDLKLISWIWDCFLNICVNLSAGPASRWATEDWFHKPRTWRQSSLQFILYFQYIHYIFDIFNRLNILKMSPTSQEPGDIYSILCLGYIHKFIEIKVIPNMY